MGLLTAIPAGLAGFAGSIKVGISSHQSKQLFMLVLTMWFRRTLDVAQTWTSMTFIFLFNPLPVLGNIIPLNPNNMVVLTGVVRRWHSAILRHLGYNDWRPETCLKLALTAITKTRAFNVF